MFTVDQTSAEFSLFDPGVKFPLLFLQRPVSVCPEQQTSPDRVFFPELCGLKFLFPYRQCQFKGYVLL